MPSGTVVGLSGRIGIVPRFSVVVRLVATPYDVFFSSHFIGQTLVASELRSATAFFKHVSSNPEGDSNVQTRYRHRALLACSMPAFAANDYPSAKMQTALPSEAMTVTDWYKQNVYDPNENKIGISKMFWSISPER